MLLLFVAISIFLMGCDKQNKTIMDNPNAINLTEEKATEMFQNMYGMPRLKDQRVILLNDTLYVDFFFDKSAGKSEFESARIFVYTTFIREETENYSEISYISLVDKAEKKLHWKNIVCDIYKNNKKVSYERFEDKQLVASEVY